MTPTLALLLAQLAGTPGQIQTPNAGRWTSQQGTFLQSGTGAGLRTLESKMRDVPSVKDFKGSDGINAQGDGLHDDTQALQAAIDAVVPLLSVTNAGILRIPCGQYKLTGELLFRDRIWLIGDGWCSQLIVAASVGASTDVLHIKPDALQTPQGYRFQDFYILPASGTPARYGINFDATNGLGPSYVVIDHIRIDTLGSYAIATSVAESVNGTPYLLQVLNSYFSGGVDMTNWGDNLLFQGNVFTGPRDIKIAIKGGSFDGGAHGLNFINNNVTVAGGTIITNAWQGTIRDNNFEQTVTSTEANNAMIDVQGNVASPGPPAGLKIEGNFIGANNLFVADAIRVDRAVHTIIRDNYVTRGSGVAYRITANADRTLILNNRQSPFGELITTWLADLGTNTQVDYIHPNSGARLLTNPGVTTNAGGIPWYVNGVQVRTAANAIAGFSSTNDPTSSGLDSGLSRLAAGQVALGNGVLNDASGLLSLGTLVASTAITSAKATLTYGATVSTDASLGNSFILTVTNGTAFTMAAPTNLRSGQLIRYLIRNTSGGAIGAITWNAVYKINATAIAPATGQSRTIEFLYDGTNLVEQFRGALDVPN